MIKRLRCVIYLDDRIPEEADILDFFNLGGARRLRSEAFRRLLLSGWMAANQAQGASLRAIGGEHPLKHSTDDKPKLSAAPNDRRENTEAVTYSSFKGKQDGLSYNHENAIASSDGDFFGKLF